MRAGRRWWSVSDVLLVLLPALTLMACEGWQVDRPPIAPSAESLTAPSSAAVFATTTGLAAQPPPTTSGKIGSSADLASLMKALRSYGLKVRSMGAIENPLLP